jgi:hypothetical protein
VARDDRFDEPEAMGPEATGEHHEQALALRVTPGWTDRDVWRLDVEPGAEFGLGGLGVRDIRERSRQDVELRSVDSHGVWGPRSYPHYEPTGDLR